jgi:hypothetical protein
MPARATMDGVDISGPSAARPKKGAIGSFFYDEDMARLLVMDGRARGLVGADGALVNDASAASIYFADHFKAAAINAAWSLVKGTDPQAVNFAVDATVKSGAVKGTAGDAGTGIAADGITIAINNPLQIGTGRAELSVSLLASAYTNLMFFVGFTDVLPSTTLEEPFSIAGAAYTSTASDACGFLFDTGATTDTVRLVGVANDVDAAHIDTGYAPAGTLDMHLRLEGSTAFFSIDGVTLASNRLPSAVRTSVNLFPVVVAVSRTTAVRDITLDFIRGGKWAA